MDIDQCVTQILKNRNVIFVTWKAFYLTASYRVRLFPPTQHRTPSVYRDGLSQSEQKILPHWLPLPLPAYFLCSYSLHSILLVSLFCFTTTLIPLHCTVKHVPWLRPPPIDVLCLNRHTPLGWGLLPCSCCVRFEIKKKERRNSEEEIISISK